MGQLQKVSWRTAGYAALGTVLAAASVVAVVNSDGVRPTSLTSNAATRWLVDQVNGTGRARRRPGRAGWSPRSRPRSKTRDEVAVQGAGGAFLVAKEQGSLRTISTAKLQLGTAQAVGLLLDPDAKFGVGASGLTSREPRHRRGQRRRRRRRHAADRVPTADEAAGRRRRQHVAAVPTPRRRTSTSTSPRPASSLRSRRDQTDDGRRACRRLRQQQQHRPLARRRRCVAVDSIPNASEAVLQEPGDDAPCVWLGVGDTLVCVGATGIDHTLDHRGHEHRVPATGWRSPARPRSSSASPTTSPASTWRREQLADDDQRRRYATDADARRSPPPAT